MNDESRARFEAFKGNGFGLRWRGKTYEHHYDAADWELWSVAWQAAHASRDAEVAALNLACRTYEHDAAAAMALVLSHEGRIAKKDAKIARLCEIIQSYHKGRCYACGWPLKDLVDYGCVPGNCSFRPGEHTRDYKMWRIRMDHLDALSGTGDK